MKYIITFLFVIILLPSIAKAAPQSSGKVERLYIRDDGLVMFRIGNSANLPSDCDDPNWPYKFNLADTSAKEWLSMLLTARAKEESINIGYKKVQDSNRCGVHYLYH